MSIFINFYKISEKKLILTAFQLCTKWNSKSSTPSGLEFSRWISSISPKFRGYFSFFLINEKEGGGGQSKFWIIWFFLFCIISISLYLMQSLQLQRYQIICFIKSYYIRYFLNNLLSLVLEFCVHIVLYPTRTRQKSFTRNPTLARQTATRIRTQR